MFKKEHAKARERIHGKHPRGYSSSRYRASPLHGIEHKAPPAGAWTQADAKGLMPPNSFIWHAAASSWQGHVPGHRRLAKSWAVAGGHTEAMRYIVTEAWRQWLGDKDLPLSSCPIAGLFGAAASAESDPA